MTTPKHTDYVGNVWQNFTRNSQRDLKTLTQSFYLRMFTELAVNRFKWTGFEDETEHMDFRPRYVELTLFNQGLAVFFEHTRFDKLLCMRATPSGNMDMYYDPTAFNIYGNGTTPHIDGHTVGAKNAIPIWANKLRTPDLDMISIYTRRIAEFDRTIDVNVLTLRHPYILFVDATNKHSVLEAYRQIQDGQPVVVMNKNVIGDRTLRETFDTFNMNIHPDMVTNLIIDQKKIWNQAMTFLGINNSNQEKRERLVAAEVAANDSEVMMHRAIALGERQAACEKINEKWGTNLWVEWNSMVDELAMFAPGGVAEKEGDENGNVHDDDSRID